MTAKEKIISGILSDAQSQADDIILSANKNAEEIKESGIKEQQIKCAAIIAEAESKAKIIAQTGESSAALIKRDRALHCKREIIEELLNDAEEEINSLADGDYFDFLLGIIKKNSTAQKGEVFLSNKDKGRDCSVFKEKIKSLGLTLSGKTADINGGFILKYGDIEINGEIKALINEKREELVDTANKLLFK